MLLISNAVPVFWFLKFLSVGNIMCIGQTDRASGLLTASKRVRDVVSYWITEGPRNSHTTDQKVWGSNPYGRARRLVGIQFCLLQDLCQSNVLVYLSSQNARALPTLLS